MINDGLVMELMKMFSANPESFPRVLSAFVRRELLQLSKSCDEQMKLIQNESKENISRRKYIQIHLADLGGLFLPLMEFLEYFRDIPLGKNEQGIVTADEIRLKLDDICSYACMMCDDLPRGDDWNDVEDDEFDALKKKALEAAADVKKAVMKVDESLALSWSESEEPEQELKADFELQ